MFSKRFRRWAIGLGVIAIVIAVVLAGLPFGLKYALERALESAGVDDVVVDDVDFNPFSGTLVIRGLSAARGESRPIQLSELRMRLALLLLLHKQIYVEEARIGNATLVIDHAEGDPLRVGGLLLPVSAGEREAAVWGFGVQRMTVTDSHVHFTEHQSRSSLDLEEFQLEGMASWPTPSPAQLRFRGQLNGASVQIDSKLSPFAEQPYMRAQLEVNDLDLAPFSLSTGPTATALGRLRVALRPVLALMAPEVKNVEGTLNADLDIETGAPTAGQTNIEGNMSVHNLRASADDGTEFYQQRIAWEGSAELSKTARGGLGARAQSVLRVNGFRLSAPDNALDIEYDGLQWDGLTVTTRSTTGFAVQQQGRLSLDELQFSTADTRVTERDLAWDGTFKLLAAKDSGALKYTADGKLSAGETSLGIEGAGTWLAKHEGLQWTGQFEYATQTAAAADKAATLPDLRWNGELRMSGLDVREPGKRLGLVSLQELELREFEGGATDFKITEARLDNIRLGVRLPEDAGSEAAAIRTLLVSDLTTLRDIRLEETRQLSAGDVEMRGAVLLLRRGPDGRFRLLEDVLGRLGAAKAPAGLPTEPAGERKERAALADGSTDTGAVVRVARVSIGGESRLRFEDETVKPTYKADLTLKEAVLRNMDSSDPTRPSPLTVVGKMGEYSAVELKGHIQPFARRLTLDLTGKIEALNMPELSPYTSSYLGYDLKSGHLDADIDVRIDAGELQGTSRLVLHNLEVVPGDPEKMQELKAQLSVPLDSAISMLSDKERNISLEVPVSGDIADPKFDFSDAINQAVGKAMKTAAVAFLKASFQPFGAMITVVELAGKAAGAVQLDPVEFPPAGDRLDDTALRYLERVSAVMSERPAVRIRLCGKSAPSDRDALRAEAEAKLKAEQVAEKKKRPWAKAEEAKTPAITDEQLRSLAKRRSESIKDKLVKDYDIPANRLFVCQPEIVEEPEAKPKVDMLI